MNSFTLAYFPNSDIKLRLHLPVLVESKTVLDIYKTSKLLDGFGRYL